MGLITSKLRISVQKRNFYLKWKYSVHLGVCTCERETDRDQDRDRDLWENIQHHSILTATHGTPKFYGNKVLWSTTKKQNTGIFPKNIRGPELKTSWVRFSLLRIQNWLSELASALPLVLEIRSIHCFNKITWGKFMKTQIPRSQRF